MSSLNSVLDIAKNALLTNQKAINVTSHNIANANTPGYTRQVAVLESMDPVNYGGLYFGTGVKAAAVQRFYDGFQYAQLRGATSSLSMYQTKGELLKSLEGIMNDFDGAGLSSTIDNFFNSIQALSNDPSSYGERASLLSNAETLSDRFNSIDAALRQNLSNANKEIEAQVNEINSLSTRVAELNGQIAAVEVAGVSANDLRDHRDELLKSLSQIIDINTVENSFGQADVYVAGGPFIVTGVNTSALSVNLNASNTEVYDIIGNGSALNGSISGGSLKGLLDGADEFLNIKDKVNMLAASMVKALNSQHAQGYGLDGSTGTDFFDQLSVYTAANANNTGRAVVSGGTVTDLGLVTLDDYEVRFSSANAYTVVNTSAGSVVTQGVYTSGSAITFDGLSFIITDDSGTPQTGDRFAVSPVKNAAMNIGVSVTDPNKVAASGTLAGIPGDNTNALALGNLREAAAVEGSTFNQYYNGILMDLGIVTMESKSNYRSQQKVVEQLQLARDSASGVSMEEEAINLIKLQRAYEAAAKVMSTADSMFETLLNLR